ncbi:MAG: PAS domain-containing protein, partial [Nitrospinota bacterium]
MKKNTKKHSPPKTEFLSPERVSSDAVSGQNRRVSEAPFTSDFFNMLPNITLILNKERQIVYCNKRILELLQVDNMDSFLGLRPGEAFRCVHSRETEGGCGTTKYCVNCGAALAILSTQKDGKSAVKECRLTLESEEGKASLDMRVWTS